MRGVKNKRVFAFITDRCCNECAYCFVYSGLPSPDMTIEQFRKLCDVAKREYEYITFIGGEPLLHPQLYDFMSFALNNGFKISISTSGINQYNEEIDRIFDLQIDDVTLSLDSAFPVINDKLRGRGSYYRTVETADFLSRRKIPFRITATICNTNKDGIFDLADFSMKMGASQLDLHVMSQKGRAGNRKDLSVSPSDWYCIRKKLDGIKYPYPFHISYPIMWYKGDELKAFQSYCDASQGNRLSIMPNGDCYYCTIAIGFPEYTLKLDDDPVRRCPKLYQKTDSLCDIEKRIATERDNYNYICRFIKRRTTFIDNNNNI